MKKACMIAALAVTITGFASATGAAIDTGSAGLGAPAQQGPPPPPDGQQVGDPCTAGGGLPGHFDWVHLDDPDAAEHYGTEWMWVCQAN
ncbi:hypothetical protein [Nocardia callitridis]|uniref:Secreted protein n=1 Tax=Nocardia callitridis TaxID=648753 RepID=A0ABP9JX35_9NOCA